MSFPYGRYDSTTHEHYLRPRTLRIILLRSRVVYNKSWVMLYPSGDRVILANDLISTVKGWNGVEVKFSHLIGRQLSMEHQLRYMEWILHIVSILYGKNLGCASK